MLKKSKVALPGLLVVFVNELRLFEDMCFLLNKNDLVLPAPLVGFQTSLYMKLETGGASDFIANSHGSGAHAIVNARQFNSDCHVDETQ